MQNEDHHAPFSVSAFFPSLSCEHGSDAHGLYPIFFKYRLILVFQHPAPCSLLVRTICCKASTRVVWMLFPNITGWLLRINFGIQITVQKRCDHATTSFFQLDFLLKMLFLVKKILVKSKSFCKVQHGISCDVCVKCRLNTKNISSQMNLYAYFQKSVHLYDVSRIYSRHVTRSQTSCSWQTSAQGPPF